jgi:hypothetical protein
MFMGAASWPNHTQILDAVGIETSPSATTTSAPAAWPSTR